MLYARISLEQWRALLAVVDHGGYAQAAEAMNKSQSSLSYAVHKLESLLGVKALTVQGRKAQLTETGEMLVRRARSLLKEAAELENTARQHALGWQAEVHLTADHLYPSDCLFQALDAFSRQAPHTRIQLHETVLGGNEEALLEKRVDLAITPIVPVGFLGDPILDIEFLAVAAPTHPLHQIDRPLDYRDLKSARQIVIRDSSQNMQRDAGWLGAEQRWTVSHMSSSIRAVAMGLGFAWFPVHAIAQELKDERLKPLNLKSGAQRHANLQLVVAEPDRADPATRLLASLIRQTCAASNT